jgi:hypothetical protein
MAEGRTRKSPRRRSTARAHFVGADPYSPALMLNTSAFGSGAP